MNLSIVYLKNLERPWLLKRVDGEYSQHAHFFNKEEAEEVVKLIKAKKDTDNKEYREAMKRLMTHLEYNRLRKKPPYHNVNRGVRA